MRVRLLLSSMVICVILFGSCISPETSTPEEIPALITHQTWEIVEESGQIAILTMDSSGYFTGSGWSGEASGCPDYNIDIANGRMSGTSMTFDMSASYCSGDGSISGKGTGTLNSSFPKATSASGTIPGTISDPLGERSFNITWTATRVSGGDVSTSPEESEFDFDVDVSPHLVIIMQGSSASVDVTVKLIRGKAQLVTLTSAEWDRTLGISARFDRNEVIPTETVVLRIETTSETPPDNYLFTVRGESTGTFRSSVDAVTAKVMAYPMPVGIPPKPASLLASDTEYYYLYSTFENWGIGFNSLYDSYSEEGIIEDWDWFWIGSTDDESKRFYFDRVEDKWKPRISP